MAVWPISKEQFDAFEPIRGPLVGVAWQEVEWFADSASTIIGVLTHDMSDDDWGYAVLGRDTRGVFRAIANDVSIARQAEARAQLVAAMEAILETGRTVFPQDEEG